MRENSKLWPAILIVGGFALVFVFLGFCINREFDKHQQDQEELGSVMPGGEFHATSTSGKTYSSREFIPIATTTPYNMMVHNSTTDAHIGSHTLGSVIISSTTDGVLRIWNSTSTTDKSSTTIARFEANNTLVGEYIFDAVMDRGIILEFVSDDDTASFNGAYTITWR